jgi:hypothetical protein
MGLIIFRKIKIKVIKSCSFAPVNQPSGLQNQIWPGCRKMAGFDSILLVGG